MSFTATLLAIGAIWIVLRAIRHHRALSPRSRREDVAAVRRERRPDLVTRAEIDAIIEPGSTK